MPTRYNMAVRIKVCARILKMPNRNNMAVKQEHHDCVSAFEILHTSLFANSASYTLNSSPVFYSSSLFIFTPL